MSYFFPKVRYLSKPSPPPPPGTKRWFANVIARELAAGEIEGDEKYVKESAYDAMERAAHAVIDEMEKEITAQRKVGFVHGFAVVAFLVAALVAILLSHGCSAAQLQTANNTYEVLHDVRKGLESIPGVEAVADAYLPWLPAARVGLDETYALKHALMPVPSLGAVSAVPAPIVMPLPLTPTSRASI